MSEEAILVNETAGLQVLDQEASLSLITKAEIDMQISTAKAFPRSMSVFLKRALSMATVTEGVAESCTYAVKRAGKTLNGPSVRLAEIVVSSYQNVRAGARVIANDGKQITAQGVCHDLETNTCVTVEVKRSILQNVLGPDGKRTGAMKTMSEDMQVVTGNAACAIAFRNSVFKVIPAALINDIYEKVCEVAKGTAETLVARRDKAINYFHSVGVTTEQICKVLEVHAIEDIDLEKLSILSGMKAAIKNEESTPAELFNPEPPAKEKADSATAATAEAIKNAGKKATGKVEPK